MSYSTYWGGTRSENIRKVVFDSTGAAYVVGETSGGLPTTSGCLQPVIGGNDDAYVTKFSPDGRVVWSTYLGGSGNDEAYGVAVDGNSNVIVVGSTQSTHFPTLNAAQASLSGSVDAFMAKIEASGSSLIYSTYWGGKDPDHAEAVAVDSKGNAYVTGITQSRTFPTVRPYRATGDGWDAFVAKFTTNGIVDYSTYFGSNNHWDWGYSIAVDSMSRAHFCGWTRGTTLPTVNAVQGVNKGGSGSYTGFASCLEPNGTSLYYSTYLGGSLQDEIRCVALDTSGSPYFVGATWSSNFPTTFGAYQSTWIPATVSKAFLTKLSPDGSSMMYSTFIAESNATYAYGVSVDSFSNACVIGTLSSPVFPETQKLQPSPGDTFLAVVNPAGTGLVLSTTIGGYYSSGRSVASDNYRIVMAGNIGTTDFPTWHAIKPTWDGTSEGFVTVLSWDTDRDGLPDWWEEAYFGGKTNAISGSDSDGDGLSDLNEFRCGASPREASSAFKLYGNNTMVDTNHVVLQWPSMPFCSYNILHTTNLLEAFAPLSTNIAATPPLNTYTSAITLGASEFFKVKMSEK